MSKQDDAVKAAKAAQDAAERFERYPTTDIHLPGMVHCVCWTVSSPFATHPAGCLCLCHGGRREG